MIRSGMAMAASAMLLVCTARGAHAQRVASWPRVGTHLVRVGDVPATPAGVPSSANSAAVITPEPCAARLRDPHTGREYMLRHSTRQEQFRSHESGATTTTTAQLTHAVGDYARIEPRGDALSTRVVTVDCLTSRVRPPQGAR
jgi:hypothetical protein